MKTLPVLREPTHRGERDVDLDQITFPDDQNDTNSKWVRRFSSEKGHGFLWFAETSYHYISPRGFKEWISFIYRFPKTYLCFRRDMAAGF